MTKVLWEEHDAYGLIVESEDRFRETMATLEALKTAETWEDVRRANLAPWANRLIEDIDQDEYNEPEPDDSPWDYEDIREMLTDSVPLPHRADRTAEWLGWELLREHAQIGGSSPAGHVDCYRIADSRHFLDALDRAGYELEHRPGLLGTFFAKV